MSSTTQTKQETGSNTTEQRRVHPAYAQLFAH